MNFKKHTFQSNLTAQDIAEKEKQARELFNASKFKQAREIYKELYKIDKEFYLNNLISCYQMQAEQLIVKGMSSEANEIYKQIETLTGLPARHAEATVSQRASLSESHTTRWMNIITDEALPREDKISAADEIVLLFAENDLLKEKHPDLHLHLLAIWNALEHISVTQFDKAIEVSGCITFNSPFSHWRLFIKGLVAWYSGDDEKARGAFERIPGKSLLRNATESFLLLCSPEKSIENSHKNPALIKNVCCIGGKKDIGDIIARAEYLHKSNRKIDAYFHLRENLPDFPSYKNAFFHDLSLMYLHLDDHVDFKSFIHYNERLHERIRKLSYINSQEEFFLLRLGVMLDTQTTGKPRRSLESLLSFCRQEFNSDPVFESVIYKKSALSFISSDLSKNVPSPLPPIPIGVFAEIEKYLELSLAADSSDKETWKFLIRLFESNNKKSKLNAVLSKMKTAFPDDIKVLKELAISFFDCGNFSKSVPLFKKVLEEDAYDDDCRHLLLISLLKLAEKSAKKNGKTATIKLLNDAYNFCEDKSADNCIMLSKAYIACYRAVLMYQVSEYDDSTASLETARSILGEFKANYFTYCSERDIINYDPMQLKPMVDHSFMEKMEINDIITAWQVLKNWDRKKCYWISDEIDRCIKITNKILKAKLDIKHARVLFDCVSVFQDTTEKLLLIIIKNQRKFYPENLFFKFCFIEHVSKDRHLTDSEMKELELIIHDCSKCGDTITERKAKNLLIHQKSRIKPALDDFPFPMPFPDFDLPFPKNKKKMKSLFESILEEMEQTMFDPFDNECAPKKRKAKKINKNIW